jgi:hypothetical protein
VGKYVGVTGSDEADDCLACVVGKYVGMMGSADCIGCAVGKYVGVTGSNEADDCIGCAVGRYASVAGSADCLACAVGKYRGGTGSYDCIGCLLGKYVGVMGSDEADDCIGCTVGKYVGVTSSDEADDCIGCMVGKYASVAGSADCIGCVVGKYVGVTGSDDCIRCEAGKYIAVTGSDQVGDCIDFAGRPALCPSGSANCELCPAGKIGPLQPNVAVADDWTCTSSTCGAGTYAEPGSTFCTKCPYPDRCVDGSTCTAGSVGVGCAACDVRAVPRWFAFQGDCVECPSTGVGALELALGCVITIVFIVIVYRLSKVPPDLDDKGLGVLRSWISFVPIVYSHLLLSSWAITLPSFAFPRWLRDLVAYLSSYVSLNFVELAKPECLDATGTTAEDVFLFKFLLTQGAFAAVAGVFLVMFLYAKCAVITAPAQARADKEKASMLANRFHNSLLALYSMFYLLIVRSAFAIFDCTRQEDGSLTLDNMPSLRCFESTTHIIASVYGVISLLMLLVVVPVYLRRKLGNSKANGTLTGEDCRNSFGWMFLRYRYGVCTWYELAFMARKTLLVMVSMQFDGEDYAHFVLLFSIVLEICFLCLQVWLVRPILLVLCYTSRAWRAVVSIKVNLHLRALGSCHTTEGKQARRKTMSAIGRSPTSSTRKP